MLSKEDIKVGQYVKGINHYLIERIVSVNSQYAYTNIRSRIYPKDYKEYIALSDEDVKSLLIKDLNVEIKDLIDNIKDLKNEVDTLSNIPYVEIDDEGLAEDLENIIERINRMLEND